MNLTLYSSVTVSRATGWAKKLCMCSEKPAFTPSLDLSDAGLEFLFRYSPSPCQMGSQATFCSENGCYFALLQDKKTTLKNSQKFPNSLSGQRRSGIKLALQWVKLELVFLPVRRHTRFQAFHTLHF